MSRTYQIVNGDMHYGGNGGVLTVTGHDKARQDVALSLAASQQPDGYGFGLVDLVGADLEPFMGEFELRRRIMDGFDRLKQLQQSSIINRTPDELFVEVVNLAVQRQRTDPRVYRWALDVRTVSGTVKQLKGSVGLCPSHG